MTGRVLRLADQIVARLVPQVEARAALQKKCVLCAPTKAKLCMRDCIQGVCEPWGCRACDTC